MRSVAIPAVLFLLVTGCATDLTRWDGEREGDLTGLSRAWDCGEFNAISGVDMIEFQVLVQKDELHLSRGLLQALYEVLGSEATQYNLCRQQSISVKPRGSTVFEDLRLALATRAGHSGDDAATSDCTMLAAHLYLELAKSTGLENADENEVELSYLQTLERIYCGQRRESA